MKSAVKKIDKLIEEFDNCGDDKLSKEKAKKNILRFINNKNVFNQKASGARKEKLDMILGNYTQESNPSPSFP